MKAQTTVIAAITVALFIVTGIILFKGVTPIYKRYKYTTELKETFLNTDKMREAGADDTVGKYGRFVISAYLFKHESGVNNSIPQADIYICGFRNDSLHIDTIVIIDTQLKSALPLKYEIKEYDPQFKKAKRLKNCQVSITTYMFNNIKKYKYKYSGIELYDIED